jgi:hypothetical protein
MASQPKAAGGEREDRRETIAACTALVSDAG